MEIDLIVGGREIRENSEEMTRCRLITETLATSISPWLVRSLVLAALSEGVMDLCSDWAKERRELFGKAVPCYTIAINSQQRLKCPHAQLVGPQNLH